MRIGIVNDMGLVREALRRVVLSSARARGRLDGQRRCRGGCTGTCGFARPDPDGPVHAGD